MIILDFSSKQSNHDRPKILHVQQESVVANNVVNGHSTFLCGNSIIRNFVFFVIRMTEKYETEQKIFEMKNIRAITSSSNQLNKFVKQLCKVFSLGIVFLLNSGV